jgi:hypothetical protein
MPEMSWVMWRQHRLAAAIGAAVLAAFAAAMLVTGVQVASQWHSALAECTASHTCDSMAGTLFLGSHAVGFGVILTLGVPVVLGLFWGAPLVARELETGTSQFAWMQSVTRQRWLAVLAGWMLLAAAVCAGAVSALVTWWSGPDNALQQDAFQPGRFDIMGIVPVGYAVFAVALGIATGAVGRRTLPAMGVTVAGFIAVRWVIFEWVRPHYMSAITHVYSLSGNFNPGGAAWQVAQGVISPSGQLIYPQNGPEIANVPLSYVPASCQGLMHHGGELAAQSCVQSAGFRNFMVYQPGNRYWAFQCIETGIFVVLAAAALAAMFAILRRRDA